MTFERVNPFSGFFSSIVYPFLPLYNIQRSAETQHRLYGATDRIEGENTQCLISCAAKKSSQYLGRVWLSTFLCATVLLSGMKIIPSVSFFPRMWLRDGFVRLRDYINFQVNSQISQNAIIYNFIHNSITFMFQFISSLIFFASDF